MRGFSLGILKLVYWEPVQRASLEERSHLIMQKRLSKALHGRFAESGLVAMVTLSMRSTVSRDEVYNACSCVYVHRKVQCVAISARETKHFRVKIASKTGLCPH